MRIDEAGRDDQIGSVDHALGAFVDLADRGNAIAGNGDVGTEARRTGPVHHRAIFDQ
jgi:hypothetical protein